MATRLAGGQQLDVVQIATEGQRIFMTKDLLEPLDDYIKKDQAAVDAYYKDTPESIRKFLQQYASRTARPSSCRVATTPWRST